MKKILLVMVSIVFITFNSGFCNIKSAYIAARPNDPRKILVLSTDFLDPYPQRFNLVNHVLQHVKMLNVSTSIFYSSFCAESDSFNKEREFSLIKLFSRKDKDFFDEGDIINWFKTKGRSPFQRFVPSFTFCNLESCQLMSLATGYLGILGDVKDGTKDEAAMIEYLEGRGFSMQFHSPYRRYISQIFAKTKWIDLFQDPLFILAKMEFLGSLPLPLHEAVVVNRLKYYEKFLRQDFELMLYFCGIIKDMFNLDNSVDTGEISLAKIYEKNPVFFSSVKNEIRAYSKKKQHKFFEYLLNAKFLCRLLSDKSYVKVLFVCDTRAESIRTDLMMSGYNVYNAGLEDSCKFESLKRIINLLA